MVEVNGRQIDTSCPWSGECFGNGGCFGECPDTLYDVLVDAARLEHELEMLPHTDADLIEVCKVCKEISESILKTTSNAVLTTNEARFMHALDAFRGYSGR